MNIIILAHLQPSPFILPKVVFVQSGKCHFEIWEAVASFSLYTGHDIPAAAAAAADDDDDQGWKKIMISKNRKIRFFSF